MRTIGRQVPADRPHGDFVSRCDYCGAPWYRSALRRDESNFLVCEPCDTGPDRMKQLRRNAELAEQWGERQAEMSEPVYDGAPFVFGDADPQSILGADCAAWLRAESASDSAWTDETGNLELAGTCSSARARNGMAVVDFDGDEQSLTGTLASPLLAGTRPYIWLLAQYIGDPTSPATTPTALAIADASLTYYAALGRRFYSSDYRTTYNLRVDNDAGTSLWDFIGANNAARIFEATLAEDADRFLVDEVAASLYQSTESDPEASLRLDWSAVAVGDSVVLPTYGNAKVRIRDVVISRVQPDSDTLEAMRDYLRGRKGFDL